MKLRAVGRSDLSTTTEHRAGLPTRIIHIHIPKTAGSALSQAFKQAYGENLRVYPEKFEAKFADVERSDFDFYTGHIGFKVASEIGGDLITVLRDPVDRFLSTYFFLRQLKATGKELTHKTFLAARYNLEQFVQIRGEPILDQELRNRMTWQIAYSHRLELRQDLVDAGVDDIKLIQIASANLKTFAVVGVQTDISGLVEAIRRKYDVSLSIGRVNVTHSRPARCDLSTETLRHLESWVHLDQELYQGWLGMHRRSSDSPTCRQTKGLGLTG